MPSLKAAQHILAELRLPTQQQNEMSALTLLALCKLKPEQSWAEATRQSMTISKGVMAFIRSYYGREYAPNTRETFRRQVLHQFVQAHIALYNPDNPALPTNSPHAHYALSLPALHAIQAFESERWETALTHFFQQQNIQVSFPLQPSDAPRLSLPDGTEKFLSPGEHNRLQVAFIRDFVPRFTRGGHVLYVGDTADKRFYVDEARLKALGLYLDEHEKLPDIILYEEERNWIFLVEVVTSHGPMTTKRMKELDVFLSQCRAGKIYLTAFPDFATFRKYARDIAWETEVWVAEVPEHLIHFDGQRFLGPYER